jgi:hypothetical protein
MSSSSLSSNKKAITTSGSTQSGKVKVNAKENKSPNANNKAPSTKSSTVAKDVTKSKLASTPTPTPTTAATVVKTAKSTEVKAATSKAKSAAKKKPTTKKKKKEAVDDSDIDDDNIDKDNKDDEEGEDDVAHGSGKNTKKTKPNKSSINNKNSNDTNVSLRDGMVAVFTDIQSSLATHARNLPIFQRLLVSRDASSKRRDFYDQLWIMLSHILIVGKREPAVERIVAFVSRFATERAPVAKKSVDGVNETKEKKIAKVNRSIIDVDARIEFATRVITWLLEKSNAKDKAVRFRVCQLVAKILHNMPEDAEIRWEQRLLAHSLS